MSKLTDEQKVQLLVITKVLNMPILAKSLRKCFEEGIDIGADDLEPLTNVIGDLTCNELNALSLELTRISNSKMEFNNMITKAIQEIDIDLTDIDQFFVSDSKIIS